MPEAPDLMKPSPFHGPGLFITFEGIDGCGKSTLLEELSRWLTERSIPHIRTREPGGTPLGESVRRLLLDPASAGAICAEAEVLLYTASRAQLLQEVIVPALNKGWWVLSDRYIDATLAYQGYGRGLDAARLRPLQEWATQGLVPNKTVLLDCPVDVALQRIRGRNATLDRIELENRLFHERVRSGYLELASLEPERFVVLDGGRPLPAVLEDFRNLFLDPLMKRFHNRIATR
jgi:dTMP kinase